MRRRARGHVLALTLICMAGVGALVAAGAQWRLSQQRAAQQRWAVQAAEVLAQSALVQAEADLRAGRALSMANIQLEPGDATLEQVDKKTVRGCGRVKQETVCLTGTWTGQQMRITGAN
jgi:Tfp pilus assembly protein PilX